MQLLDKDLDKQCEILDKYRHNKHIFSIILSFLNNKLVINLFKFSKFHDNLFSYFEISNNDYYNL